jgi:hypothetical protein
MSAIGLRRGPQPPIPSVIPSLSLPDADALVTGHVPVGRIDHQTVAADLKIKATWRLDIESNRFIIVMLAK